MYKKRFEFQQLQQAKEYFPYLLFFFAFYEMDMGKNESIRAKKEVTSQEVIDDKIKIEVVKDEPCDEDFIKSDGEMERMHHKNYGLVDSEEKEVDKLQVLGSNSANNLQTNSSREELKHKVENTEFCPVQENYSTLTLFDTKITVKKENCLDSPEYVSTNTEILELEKVKNEVEDYVYDIESVKEEPTVNKGIEDSEGLQSDYETELCGHMRGDETNKTAFQCQVCSNSFPARSSLLMHELTHSGEKPLQCKSCSESFSDFPSLVVHQRTHEVKKYLKPHQHIDIEKFCPKILYRLIPLTRRQKTHEEKTHHCKVCSKTFSRGHNLRKHEKIHRTARDEEKPFKCEFCSKTFDYGSSLKTHLSIFHSDANRVPCKFCLKSFIKGDALTIHEATHTGENPFRCKVCFKSFIERGYLERHERIHAKERAFHCGICSKYFFQRSNFEKHERIHTHEKPFHCRVCSKAFIQRGELLNHERIHTGEKPLEYKVCSKDYSNKSHLAKHESIHTEEHPFQCKVFSKSYASGLNLEKHEKTNTGERPFNCKMCSKSFSQHHYLLIHERIHTEERPFNCEVCSRSFLSRSGLTNHQRTHKRAIPLQPLL